MSQDSSEYVNPADRLAHQGSQQSGSSGSRIWLWGGCLGFIGVVGLCALVGLFAFIVDGDEQSESVAEDETTVISESSAPTATTEPAEPDDEATSPADDGDEPDPTPTPEVEPEPTEAPDPPDEGETSGRSNPVPIGETALTPNGEWQARVNEVVRGDEAWQRILDANQFNDPPRDGMEYVLVNVTMSYTGDSSEAQRVDSWDFNSTGDARVRWRTPSVVVPEPELRGNLFAGGEVTGWVALYARAGESDLIAIYEPGFSLVEGDELFLAIEENASVEPLMERSAEVNDLGASRDQPAPFGERVVTENWEIRIVEAIRGDDAWALVEETNQFNDPPPDGMEYIAVRVGARNVKAGHGSDLISTFMFESTGDSNVVHSTPSVVNPEPELWFDVYAGGEVEGWVVLQAEAGEGNLSMVFQSQLFGGETRYLALD